MSFGQGLGLPSVISFGHGLGLPSVISFGQGLGLPSVISFGQGLGLPSVMSFGQGLGLPSAKLAGTAKVVRNTAITKESSVFFIGQKVLSKIDCIRDNVVKGWLLYTVLW